MDKRATALEEDAGDYRITVSLIERHNRAQMHPARTYELILTVGEVIPPEPLPVLKAAPDGVKLPKMEIKEFMPDGVMRITVSKPLEFPSDLMQRYNDIRQNPVPLYGESKEIGYIRNMMRIELVSVDGNDESMLGYDFNITALEPTEIEVTFTFENPIAISQGHAADSLFVTINMEQYTDPDGLSIGRDYNMTSLITRQLPAPETQGKLVTAAVVLIVLGSLVVIGHVVGCILLNISFNQLWSAIYGLQLAAHMPLYFTRFPANANSFLYVFIDFTTMEIFPRSATDGFFDLPVRDSFNVNFQASRYESMYTVANARMCFLLITLYLVQCLVWVVLQRLKDKGKCVSATYEKYNSLLYWQVLIRLVFFMYLELALSCFVNLAGLQFAPNDFSAIVSNIVTLLFTLIIIGLPVFIWTYFGCNVKEINDAEFDKKFGEFYSGLQFYHGSDFNKRKAVRYRNLFYPFWFVMRRFLFAFSVVVAEENLGL